MKKIALATTAALGLLSTSGAMAQSTVTLYGIVDGGYNHVSGLKNGSSNTIASGIMSGSRFGFKGTEDIGGGYKAIFTLENRFEVDTGTVSNRALSGSQVPDRFQNATLLGLPTALQGGLDSVAAAVGNTIGVNLAGNFFDRQAFVGLITPVGAVTLGRQYTPAFLVGATFDTMQTDSSLAAGQLVSVPAGVDIRLSNTIQYAIQASGVTAALMYGAGEVAGQGSSAGRFYGGMAIYKGAGFSAGLGYNTKNNSRGEKSLTSTIIGATLDAGPGTIYSEFGKIKDENPDFSSNPATFAGFGPFAAAVQNAYDQAFIQDGNLAHVGYKITSGVHTVAVAYTQYDDKRPNNADVKSYGAAYTYALSKRTNLNAVVTRFNNEGLAQVAPGGGGFVGGVTASAGTDSTNVALGIRHSF